jgi:hypothetical protein
MTFPSPRRSPSRPRRLPPLRGAGRTLGTVAWLLVLQAVLVSAFVLPGYKPEPHHVPVGVVGPDQVARALEAKGADDFTVHRYASEAEARKAVEERDVYGAVVAANGAKHVLIASAASNTVAQMLRGAAGDVPVQDLKPLDPDDPRGSTINLLMLPLISVCFTSVLVLGSLRLRARTLLVAIGLLSALGGLAVVALLAKGLGAMPGPYLSLAGVMALTVLAMALPTAALHRLLGQAGIGIGAVLFLVLANPASGNGSAPELLPGFWRAFGQLMPPGAGGTGLRNTSYFDGNAVTGPLVVLGCFALVGGLGVLAADALRRRRGTASPAQEEPLARLDRAA